MARVDLDWRPPTLDDVPSWVELLAAIERVDHTGEVLGAEDLLDLIGLSYFDAARDARLLWAGEEPVAFGTVLCLPGSRPRRVVLDGAVRPDWRGRGVGTALIGWQAARGAEVGAAAGTDGDGWLELSCGDSDTRRAQLFAAEGFAPIRYYFEMRRPLDGAVPEPVVPEGLTLVPYAPGRDEAVRVAHNEAFRDHWGSSEIDAETWGAWVTGHHDFRADCSMLVLDGDEVAGYALNSLHPADWPALGFREGWTHQLGVRRPWRGRGVARALLDATARRFAAEGLEFATLDVDADNPTGALALYQGVGYRRDRCRVAWARPLPK